MPLAISTFSHAFATVCRSSAVPFNTSDEHMPNFTVAFNICVSGAIVISSRNF
ncbi:hypothetical protein [Bacillus mycoides]|uniref:hypothetical protein n=1 Tax=Bacillus mycoides TaxID=1405 RepID=UPI0020789109|nr:hypothetical protein [Bacillus mycoides]